MTFGSAQSPIKVGVLCDFVLPAPGTWDVRSDFLDALRLPLEQAVAAKQLDRPVELIVRDVEGLPRGDVKSVVDAYAAPHPITARSATSRSPSVTSSSPIDPSQS